MPEKVPPPIKKQKKFLCISGWIRTHIEKFKKKSGIFLDLAVPPPTLSGKFQTFFKDFFFHPSLKFKTMESWIITRRDINCVKAAGESCVEDNL